MLEKKVDTFKINKVIKLISGSNCKAPDGTIIKEGETYNPDPFTSCTCAMPGFGGLDAICAHRPPHPVTVQTVS